MPMPSGNTAQAHEVRPARGATRWALRFAWRGLYVVHLSTTAIIVFGWIPPATRMLNWYLIVATFVSWLGLGLVFGFGFCLFTSVQSRIQARLGETRVMKSFMKDVFDRLTGRDLDAQLVEIVTQVVFYFSAAASFYVNFGYQWIGPGQAP